MSIRSFRKRMKPIIWIITILMIASGLGYVMTVGTDYSGSNNVALKLNGKKIPTLEVDRTIQMVSEQYGNFGIKNVPDNAMEILGVNGTIEKYLLLNMANEAKISVSSKDVETKYKETEEGITKYLAEMSGISDVKSEIYKNLFKNWLNARGYTKDTFKSEIKDNLKIEGLTGSFKNKAKEPTEAEIEKYYAENKNIKFSDVEFDKAKVNIIEMLKQEEAGKVYSALLTKAKKVAKIEDINERYKNFTEKEVKNIDGISITNLELAKIKLSLIPYLGEDMSKLDELTNSLIEKQVAMIQAAKKRGIKVNEELPLESQITEYQEGLYEKIKSELNPTEEQLKEYFESNRLLYDTHATSDIKIAILKLDYSPEDLAKNKEKAEKLLREVTIDNFREKAKEFGQDGSAQLGGALGEFSKGEMIPAFSEAVFNGEVGKIIPNVVTTDYGDHIVWVEAKDEAAGKAKASHILLMPEFSEKTNAVHQNEIKEIESKILLGETPLDKLSESNKNILYAGTVQGVTAEGFIPNITTSKELTDVIFESNLNEVSHKILGNNAFIFQKTNEIKAEKAEFEKIKEKIKIDYLNRKATEEMEKLF
ncbi:peptidylprolyl isomerase [Fusobacterium sp. PH5-44]|uniref:peptidylprolyl isomerase n=1 Tax=unclassified Fusobacterium TaxID=2648384 RepID=UPI003D24C23B